MQGPLFPVSMEDRNDSPSVSRSTSRTHSQANQRRQHQLLDALLVQVQWNGRGAEKQKKVNREHTFGDLSLVLLGSVISAPTSPTPSASSSISRTLHGCLLLHPLHRLPRIALPLQLHPHPLFSSSKSGWFKSPPGTPPNIRQLLQIFTARTLRHSCNLHSRSTSVLPSESPLHLNPTHSSNRMHSTLMTYHGRRRSTSTSEQLKKELSSSESVSLYGNS